MYELKWPGVPSFKPNRFVRIVLRMRDLRSSAHAQLIQRSFYFRILCLEGIIGGADKGEKPIVPDQL